MKKIIQQLIGFFSSKPAQDSSDLPVVKEVSLLVEEIKKLREEKIDLQLEIARLLREIQTLKK